MKTFRHFFRWLAAFVPLLPVSPASAAQKAAKGEFLVYIGTYTGRGGQGSQGIYAYRLDAATGKVTSLGLAGEVANPSFLAIHPNRHFLYAVTESGGQGTVSAFSLDLKTAKLTFLNKASSHGGGPCYVRCDHTGKAVLVANYGTGSVALLPIKPDGSLSEASAFIQHTGSGTDPRRQRGPHAHSINPSPDNRFAVAADLGLDELLVYRMDAARGTLVPNNPPFAKVAPGSGPRHFAFHPNGKFAYVVNEMKSTVTAFSWTPTTGVLTELQTVSTLPEGYDGSRNTGAEIQVHPNGRFVYSSNRGHDSIAVFAVNPAKGTLTPVEQASTQGKEPRGFGIDPTGSYLFAANQNTNNIAVLRIDQQTGKLTPTGEVLEVGRPVCVKFVAVK
jgi:6-phosphogluconolactonase